MKLSPLKPFIVGIDPGKHTGVAFWRRDTEKIYFSGEKDFYSVQLFLVRSFPDNRNKPGTDRKNHKETVKIFVEHPPTFMYARNDVEAGIVRDRKQQMQAGNRREAELLAMCLTARGFDVQLVPPVHEKKWTQEKYTLFTGSSKRTSEHERDACRLAVVNANWRPEY